jgi:hypothetical protein
MNPNDQRPARLHMEISRVAPLAPLQQLPKPCLRLNGLHVVCASI